MNKFWMVWNNRRDLPSVKHDSKTSAKNEAQRLATANPMDVFIILESVGHYNTVSPVKFTKHGTDQSIDYEDI